MGLLVSYNIACKEKHPTFFENVDMIRINTPWYTEKELIDVLQNQTKPKFVDVNIKTRTKAKISDFDHQKLLKILGENGVEWVGISNIEDTNTYNYVRKHLANTKTKICAKIETQKGCYNKNAIIKKYDGIMVDTEDLAFEIGWKKASIEKSRIYQLCQKENKTHFRLNGVIFGYIDYKKTVYTYGAWDLLHPGHIKMLETAKSYGDKLIVGVVDDDAIKELKGKDRPIQPLKDRIKIVSNLKCVDSVISQIGYNPNKNLEYIKPDILVKGDDWDYIPGENWIKKNNKKLIKPPYSGSWSTSKTVKKIRGEK